MAEGMEPERAAELKSLAPIDEVSAEKLREFEHLFVRACLSREAGPGKLTEKQLDEATDEMLCLLGGSLMDYIMLDDDGYGKLLLEALDRVVGVDD